MWEWASGQFRPRRRAQKPAEQISMKLGIYSYVVGMITYANPYGAAIAWVVTANT